MKYIASVNSQELEIINQLLYKTESKDIYDFQIKINKLLRKQSKDKLYCIWKTMRQRCNNSNSHDYKWYGAVGIKICEEWNDAEKFIEWAEKAGYKKGLTIDRIDNNGDYCPENCRWITIQQQQMNKRNCLILEYKGQKHTITEWSEITGISRNIIYDRHHKKWEVGRILEQKPMPIGKYIRDKKGVIKYEGN